MIVGPRFQYRSDASGPEGYERTWLEGSVGESGQGDTATVWVHSFS